MLPAAAPDDTTPSTPPPGEGRRRSQGTKHPPALRDTAAFFGAVLLGSLLLQFSFPQLIGSDGFFHLRMASDPLGGMPWMPDSIFSGGWVDHQFLFHLLMAPFAALVEGPEAAKYSAAVFAALALTGCYRFLQQEGAPAPALFALFPAAASWLFVLRMEMPRAQSISLLFLVLGIACLARQRLLLTFVVSWAYMASYQVALVLLPAALLHSLLLHRSSEHRGPAWGGSAAVSAGLIAGLVVHPHSPRTLRFLYQHVVQKTLNRAELPVGGEWVDGLLSRLTSPAVSQELLQLAGFAALPLAALVAAFVLLRRAQSRCSPEALLLFVLALAAQLGLLAGSKAVEYAAPLSALALALALRDAGGLPGLRRSHRVLAGTVLAIGLVLSGLKVRAAVLESEPAPGRLSAAMDFLGEHAREGERIFHFSWNDFPELVWHGPEFRYVVGLDPHFLQLEDPDLWTLYDRLGGCWGSNPSKPIRDRFGSRWAVLTLPWTGARSCLEQDPNMVPSFENAAVVVYRIEPASSVQNGGPPATAPPPPQRQDPGETQPRRLP